MMPRVLWRKLTNRKEVVPRVAVGPFRTDSTAWQRLSESGLRVTWFGHSSMLLEIDGVRVLIDPVWEQRASPVEWAGPKRFFAPTIALKLLPHVDVVLISHDHYDHLGRHTVGELARLMPAARWVTGLGVGAILRSFGVAAERITELDWTESTLVQSGEGTGLQVTAVPARHFSGRKATNRNETLWSSFVLKGERHKVYYGADSGMWDGFRAIGAQHGPFDLTMLEVGAFDELWRDIHLGPDGAANAFDMLGGGLLMPIHWGLFDLALHGWREPMERVMELMDGVVFSPEPGRVQEVAAGVSDWWQSDRAGAARNG